MFTSSAWDKNTFLITALLGFASSGLENVNLHLAVILKIIGIINFFVYILINYKRIKISTIRTWKKIF